MYLSGRHKHWNILKEKTPNHYADPSKTCTRSNFNGAEGFFYDLGLTESKSEDFFFVGILEDMAFNLTAPLARG